MRQLPQSVRLELDNLEIQFPGQSQITLDQYAKLYQINRGYASQHLRRRGIPATKEGRQIYISTLDLAIYKAQRKLGNETRIDIDTRTVAEKMNSRRGFNKMAERRMLQR